MCISCSTMPSEYSSWPEMPRSSSLTWVRKCMRVPLHHTNQGVPAALLRSMKSRAAATVSSSTDSWRFLVSGPVSSMRPSA